MVGDVAGVVVDLRLIRGHLVLMIGRDAGVADDFTDRGLPQRGAGVQAASGWDRGDGTSHQRSPRSARSLSASAFATARYLARASGGAGALRPSMSSSRAYSQRA